MKNILHWILFITRLILMLLLLPLIIIWYGAKYLIFRLTLLRNLRSYGIPYRSARIILKGTGFLSGAFSPRGQFNE